MAGPPVPPVPPGASDPIAVEAAADPEPAVAPAALKPGPPVVPWPVAPVPGSWLVTTSMPGPLASRGMCSTQPGRIRLAMVSLLPSGWTRSRFSS